MTTPRILPLGDTAVTIEFASDISAAANAAVMALDGALTSNPPSGLIETVPTFRSLTLHVDPLVTTIDDVARHALTCLDGPQADSTCGRTWQIPVCYDDDTFALDLPALAETLNLPPDEIIARHAAVTYRVYMLGFLPGLPYLGDIDPAIDQPRRTDPRVRVPAGSVAIAAGLSVIYPIESPGGWHILGRTPCVLFDTAAASPALLAPGDRVRFRPVTRAEYDTLLGQPGGGAVASTDGVDG